MSDQKLTPLITKIRRLNKPKLLLNLIVILVAFLACYVEDIYLFFLTPQSGETAVLTFRSQSSFAFDQEKAFAGLRNAAVARHIPIYVYVPNKLASTKEKMEALIDEVSRDPVPGENWPGSSRELSAKRIRRRGQHKDGVTVS